MKTQVQTQRGQRRGLILLPAAFLVATTLAAADWPQYRGSNHDGISTETIRTNWSEEAPRQVWKVPLQPGLSSLAISGGRVFTLVRPPGAQPTTEYCVALDANTGNELWRTPVGVADYPNGGVGSDDGPRSTPSVDGDRVYVLATYLNLLCLNAATGSVVWSNNIVATYGGSPIDWQSAASPLLEGDLIFVHCNAAASNQRLLAFRKQDGTEAWHGPSQGSNNRMTQATPVVATIAGVRQVVFFAQSGLVSVVPETGVVLWRYPFPFSISTAASPVVGNGVVYCSAAYGVGAGAVRITSAGGQFATNEVWRTQFDNQNHWATPVYFNEHIYGLYGQNSPTLECLEVSTGTSKWAQGGFGYGSVLIVNDLILATSEDGFMVLVRPNPAAYSEVVRFRALDGSHSSIPGLGVKCWNAPAISNGRIYVRSTTEAVCLDVATAVVAPLKLQPALTGGSGGFRLLIGNEDGSPLDSNRVANIDIFASTNLTVGLTGWIKLTNSTTLTNGQIRLDDPQSTSRPERFFRVEERP